MRTNNIDLDQTVPTGILQVAYGIFNLIEFTFYYFTQMTSLSNFCLQSGLLGFLQLYINPYLAE